MRKLSIVIRVIELISDEDADVISLGPSPSKSAISPP